jgi:hypothetical protein
MALKTPVAFLLLCCAIASAQTAQPGQTELRGMAGYSTFIDESPQDHFAAGGSAHFYLTRRFSVGPEFLYMYHNEFDKDITAAATFAWDFKGGPRAQPYVAGHVGVLRQYGGSPGVPFVVHDWSYGAGLGVKIALTRRLFLVPDFRIGLEPIVRATIGVNYVLGR